MRRPSTPPVFSDLWDSHRIRLPEIMKARAVSNKRYLHWDELRHRAPPGGLSHEEWWFATKLERHASARRLPILDKTGSPHSYNLTPRIEELLHDLTQRLGGSLGSPTLFPEGDLRDRFLIRNLMEEGIASSLLEGAATTRDDALEMLRSDREPITEAERMVANNYATMRYIVENTETPFTEDMLFDLHKRITRGTLEKEDAYGRYRLPDERITVQDVRTGEHHHIPPDAAELSTRMRQLFQFANDEIPGEFVHPVIRSIVLHYWLAYEHPLWDGNGRTARTLFYWSMLKHGYWLTQFISISQHLYLAPTDYGRAFLYTQTDENDLTYFILHQLEVIRRSVDGLYDHLDRRFKERHRLENELAVGKVFNDRQVTLLMSALRESDQEFTIYGHERRHGIVYQTARTDLLDLAEKGLLNKRKRGRTFVFVPVTDLAKRLEKTVRRELKKR